MEAPEKVLCQAHGQARTVTDFLHENGNTFYPKCSYVHLVMIAGGFHLLLFSSENKLTLDYEISSHWQLLQVVNGSFEDVEWNVEC